MKLRKMEAWQAVHPQTGKVVPVIDNEVHAKMETDMGRLLADYQRMAPVVKAAREIAAFMKQPLASVTDAGLHRLVGGLGIAVAEMERKEQGQEGGAP